MARPLRRGAERRDAVAGGSGAASPGDERWRRFRTAYGAHRAAEGRAIGDRELLALPYLRAGPWAREWSVRARTFDRFVAGVLDPRAREVAPRTLRIADLGAGNGWLCYRAERLGHRAVAVDLRTDTVDGLGAAVAYRGHLLRMFARVAAAFDRLPLGARTIDVAVFNASLHYAVDLPAVLRDAASIVMAGGRIAILDSPFYTGGRAGDAMVAEKHRRAASAFGDRVADLTALPFIDYLTPHRLATASEGLGLQWRRHRVRYPLWYEMRPVQARLRRRRPPSRFDLWESTVP